MPNTGKPLAPEGGEKADDRGPDGRGLAQQSRHQDAIHQRHARADVAPGFAGIVQQGRNFTR